MHELSIAQALVEQIAKTVQSEGARKASKVTVAVGVLSGVEPHSLEMAFPIAVEAAGLEEVDLEIVKVGSSVRCRSCGHEFEPDRPLFLCESCDSADVEIIAGRELSIRSLQIEK